MKQLENLLDLWAAQEHHRDKGFIRDGIIDHRRWKNAPRKVLLLLKEAYGENPEHPDDWDLCRVIRDEWKGPKYKIWQTAAYWCYLAHHSASGVPEIPSTVGDCAAATEALLSSAIVNIKKSDGRKSSTPENIQLYATRDGHLIKQEIDLIAPEIVICGYTWPAVKHLWPNAHRVYDLVWKIDSAVFVDFWHPANQFPHALNYYALGCLLQNSKHEQKV